MPSQLKPNSTRAVLAITWFLFFGLNMGLVMYLYLRDQIESDNFNKAITQLNASYVTYLGVIVTFYLRVRGRTRERREEKMALAVALMGSLFWNLAIFVFIARLALGSGTVEDSVEQIGKFSAWISWLVAPTIGFYFAQASLSDDKLPSNEKKSTTEA